MNAVFIRSFLSERPEAGWVTTKALPLKSSGSKVGRMGQKGIGQEKSGHHSPLF